MEEIKDNRVWTIRQQVHKSCGGRIVVMQASDTNILLLACDKCEKVWRTGQNTQQMRQDWVDCPEDADNSNVDEMHGG